VKKKKDKLNEDFEKKAFQEEQAAEKASEELAANANDETQDEPDLMKRMTELEQENQELKDKYLRSMA